MKFRKKSSDAIIYAVPQELYRCGLINHLVCSDTKARSNSYGVGAGHCYRYTVPQPGVLTG